MRLNSDPNDWIQCEFTGKPITNTNDSFICYQILTTLLVLLRTCIVTVIRKIKRKQKQSEKKKKNNFENKQYSSNTKRILIHANG